MSAAATNDELENKALAFRVQSSSLPSLWLFLK